MEIVQVLESEYLELQIDGELDAHYAISLDDVIKDALQEGNNKIAINCRNLRYISSAGVGVFISHLDDFKSHGGRLVFYGMSESVYTVYEILGLHHEMKIVNEREEAQRYLNEG